jgi:hypothetical protein
LSVGGGASTNAEAGEEGPAAGLPAAPIKVGCHGPRVPKVFFSPKNSGGV